jgi:hypothetical protein
LKLFVLWREIIFRKKKIFFCNIKYLSGFGTPPKKYFFLLYFFFFLLLLVDACTGTETRPGMYIPTRYQYQNDNKKRTDKDERRKKRVVEPNRGITKEKRTNRAINIKKKGIPLSSFFNQPYSCRHGGTGRQGPGCGWTRTRDTA